jgi:hypothetical protein
MDWIWDEGWVLAVTAVTDLAAIIAGVTVRAIIDDIQGRPVQLTEERWSHIVERHPEILTLEETVVQAVQVPDAHLSGRLPNEEWFYLRTEWPSNWLKVVVLYAEDRGQIVTAFARRSVP